MEREEARASGSTDAALVVQGRALILVENEPDLIDVMLDRKIREELTEINNLQAKVDGLERTIGTCLHALSFQYPDIATRLRLTLNKFYELQGVAPMPKDVDPMSRKNKDGVSEADEQARIEAEAEEAARKAMEEADEADLTPAQKKTKFLERKRREKCKRLYLKVARMTHPDKVKDSELNNVFHQAKKAYEGLDLDTLEMMHKDVSEYVKLKGNRGKFRDFKMTRLKHSQSLKRVATGSLRSLETSMAYECTKAYQSGDVLKARSLYEDFIDEQCDRVQNAIRDLQAQMRIQRSEAELRAWNTSASSTSTW